MAIAKWMGFGGGQSSTTGASAEEANKVKRVYGADYKQFGFENFGNTCYANSVLQALYFCHPFRELVMQAPDRSNAFVHGSVPATSLTAPNPTPAPTLTAPPPLSRTKTSRKQSAQDVRPGAQSKSDAAPSEPTGPPIPATPPTLYSALRSLFIHIANNGLDNGTVAPRAFVDKVKKENELFRGTMHQDAHEFFNYLLNKVSEELEEEFKAHPPLPLTDDLSSSVTSSKTPSYHNLLTHRTSVNSLFEGVLSSETRCLTCENVSTRDEAFLDLSIDIEQNSSVTACLRQFSASEMLCQRNKFFCDGCCGLQEAEKRMKIKKLPNVLALHLKRFKYQEDLQKYIKLAYRVVFPFELRLFNTVDNSDNPDRLYELFAIIVHIGNGPNQGHYISIVKSRGSWVVFDDDTVEKIKEADIGKYFGESNSGAAYVLYYQAVDLDWASLGLRSPAEPGNTTPPQPNPPSPPLQPPVITAALTGEADSDLTDSSPSMTPAFHPDIATATPPTLTLSIPQVSESPAPMPIPIGSPTTPSQANGHGKSGGFFGHNRLATVTHAVTSSLLPEPHHHNTAPSQGTPQSPTLTSQSPALPRSLPATIPVVPATPTRKEDKPLSKTKSTRERTSGWFSKRRSLKTDKAQELSSSPSNATQASTSSTSKDESLMAKTGLRAHGLVKRNSIIRRSANLTEMFLGSPDLKVPGKPGSVHSTLSSDSRSGSAPPPAVPDVPNGTTSVAAAATDEPSQFTSAPLSSSPASYPKSIPSPRPEHKKSQPIISDRTSSASTSASISASNPPKRPHTSAGASPSPSSPHPNNHTFTPGSVPVAVPVPMPLPTPFPRSNSVDPTMGRPSTAAAQAQAQATPPARPPRDPAHRLAPNLSSSTNSTRPASTSHDASPSVRSPSRKLSLSSGINSMLNFGKKDRHKDKDKDKEKDKHSSTIIPLAQDQQSRSRHTTATGTPNGYSTKNSLAATVGPASGAAVGRHASVSGKHTRTNTTTGNPSYI